MLGNLKIAIPLLIQLLGEIFRADGEGKSSVGLKIAVLFNLLLIAVVGFTVQHYFQLYHEHTDLRIQHSQVQHERKMCAERNDELLERISVTVPVEVCKEDPPPSDSYKREPVAPPRRPTHDKEHLLSIVNG